MEKAAIETYLLREARLNGFPATVLHPGRIIGPGWNPLNPAGHFRPEVLPGWRAGRRWRCPTSGWRRSHHVHADDVAQLFERAVAHRSAAVGESFPRSRRPR